MNNNSLINYLVFIDESGQKEFIDPYNKTYITQPEKADRNYWLRNYFVITGLIVKRENIPIINREIVNLKVKTFGTPEVEIKSDWLRNPFQRKKHYLNKFHISEVALNQFGVDVSNLFPKYKKEIKIATCIFDKRYYKDRKINDPFCNAGQVLFERVEFFMNRVKSYCILVVNQMESSLNPERGRNGELKDVLLNKRRMKNTFVETYARIKDINFRKSKDENFLQLVDLAGYNIFRQFVDYGRNWEDISKKKLKVYKYFSLLSDNFIEKNGQIRGVGICKLPDIAKVNWVPVTK